MKVSFKCKLMEEPEFKCVGQNQTPLTTLKVCEDVWGKKDGEFVVKDQNFFEVKLWGDKAVDAQMLEVGQKLDFTHEGDNFKAMINENSWDWKGKTISKLEVTAFDFSVIEREDS